MLSRQPQAVSLSNHRIARHTPAKPLSNRAGRLSRHPKPLQQCRPRLVPLGTHAEVVTSSTGVRPHKGQLVGSVSPLVPNQPLILEKRGVSGTDVGVVALACTVSILARTLSGGNRSACRPMASAPSSTSRQL